MYRGISGMALPKEFKLLYPDEMNIRDKITTLAQEIYGADDVSFEDVAAAQIDQFENAGFGNLPICMAKTHFWTNNILISNNSAFVIM